MTQLDTPHTRTSPDLSNETWSQPAPEPQATVAPAPSRRQRLQTWLGNSDPFLVGQTVRGVDWLTWAAVLLVCGTVYAGVLNPYWVRAGDGDFYMALARNIAQGEGFRHNGQPVAMTPPGWPLLLAGALHVTGQFFYLKLINAAFLLGTAGLLYWAFRRVAGVTLSAVVVLAIATTPTVVSLTYEFLTEPPFCFLTAAALLLGLQVSEKRWGHRTPWAIALLAIVVALSVTVRWPGILLVPVVIAAIYSGNDAAWWRPRWDRRLFASLLVAVAGAGTFFALRAVLVVDPTEVDPRYPATMTNTYDLINKSYDPTFSDYLERAGRSGTYLSALLWELPARTRPFREDFNLLGWLILALGLVGGIWAGVQRRQWTVLGAFAFALPIMFTWPSTVPRYTLPVAPLIVLGAMLAFFPLARQIARLAFRRHPHASRIHGDGWARVAVGVTLTGVFVCSATVHGMEWMTHQGRHTEIKNFYGRVEGGTYREMPSIAWYLLGHAPPDAEIAVSSKSYNRHVGNATHGWMRAYYLLLDRPVQVVPYGLSENPERSPELAEWLHARGIRYYIYQPRIARFMHFRDGALPAWLYQGVDPWLVRWEHYSPMHWQLWEMRDGQLVRLRPPRIENWPSSYPALYSHPAWERLPSAKGKP